jgi:hypothetical protein
MGVHRNRRGFSLKPGIAVATRNSAGRRACIVTHACRIQRIDGRGTGPGAHTAVIAVKQHGDFGGTNVACYRQSGQFACLSHRRCGYGRTGKQQRDSEMPQPHSDA